MSKGKWSKGGVPQNSMKSRDERKGQNWKSDDMVTHIKDDIKRYFPKDGENCVRIVEPVEVDDLAYYGFHVHYHRNVGITNAMFLCLMRMLKQPCPICELQTDELWKADPETAKSYYPSEGMLMWVLNPYADSEEGKSDLLLWQCPITLAEEILTQSNRKGTNVYINVSDPVNGCLVYFDRIKTGKAAWQVEYTGVQVAHDQLLPLTDEVADQRVLFVDCLVVPTYEEVADEFGNVAPDHESDELSGQEETADVGQEPDVGSAATDESGPAKTSPGPDEEAETSFGPDEEAEFVPEWCDTVCSECGADQFTSPSGNTCENGHGGAEGISKEEWEKRNTKEPAPAPPPKRPVRPSTDGATKTKVKTEAKTVPTTDIKAKLKAAIAKHKKV